jgi:hypothetical protein
MKRLLITVIAVCSSTGASADSLLKTFINNVSNPGIDRKYNGIGRVNLGKFYMYKLDDRGTATEAIKPTTHEKIAADVEQMELPDPGPGYDPIAIKAALEWQASNDPNKNANPWNSDNVMTNVESKETDLLYGDDSPLRDDAVTAAWAKVHALEKKLKDHRAYMKSVVKTKNSVSKIKENDPK